MNSERSFFFPMRWAVEAPEIWEWVRKQALHVEMSFVMQGWDVWMPLDEED